jgi:glyoxylase-like metal-dependent hydrolase (beta-lactamase superfamily II)
MFTQQTWKVGTITIHSIIETEAWSVVQETIPDATPENIKKLPWLQPHYADADGNLKWVVQSFLIQTGERNILVDACVGNGRERPDVPVWHQMQTTFLERLSALCPLEEVDTVLCTHLHFDHVGWNTRKEWDSRIPTFPHARYLFGETEFEYRKNIPDDAIKADANAIRDSVTPIVKAGLADLVDSDHVLCEWISLFPTHGHTPWHVSVRISSQWETAVISGDVVHHPCHITHPEWYTGADVDIEMAKKSRQVFVNQCCDEWVLLIGSHFAVPSAWQVEDVDGQKQLTNKH